MCKMNGGVLDAESTHNCEDHEAKPELDHGIASQPSNRHRLRLAWRGRSKLRRQPKPIDTGEGQHDGEQDELDR
jgi:hypothetical protein